MSCTRGKAHKLSSWGNEHAKHVFIIFRSVAYRARSVSRTDRGHRSLTTQSWTIPLLQYVYIHNNHLCMSGSLGARAVRSGASEVLLNCWNVYSQGVHRTTIPSLDRNCIKICWRRQSGSPLFFSLTLYILLTPFDSERSGTVPKETVHPAVCVSFDRHSFMLTI